MKGRYGEVLVSHLLWLFGEESLIIPYNWPIDIITRHGNRLGVKFANWSPKYKNFACHIKPAERKVVDYEVIACCKQTEYFFYIIPREALPQSSSLSLNPYSAKPNHLDCYRDRWDQVLPKKKQVEKLLAERVEIYELNKLLGSMARVFTRPNAEIANLLHRSLPSSIQQKTQLLSAFLRNRSGRS